MTQSDSRYAIHPAHGRLRRAAWQERAALARALGIEADWLYHDGPEWAARYWQAFGDLENTRACDPAHRSAFEAAVRQHRQMACSDSQAQGMRALFRHLLACLHPDVTPAARHDDRAGQWESVREAYRRGDPDELRRIARRCDTRGYANGLRLPAAQLRREHKRLSRVRAAVDRRLAGMANQFPYCLRGVIDDPAWVAHKRRVWRQALAVAAPGRLAGSVTASTGWAVGCEIDPEVCHEQVSLPFLLPDAGWHDRHTAHTG